MATLWSLRQEMIEDLGAEGTHELMLVDIAVTAYYHMLRFNGWIGDLALQVEHEFFGQESPSAKFKNANGYGTVQGLRVEDSIGRLGEQLLPLMDRSQRMFIRALRELRRPPPPNIAIAQAGQVNVGTLQQNTAQVPEPQLPERDAPTPTAKLGQRRPRRRGAVS